MRNDTFIQHARERRDKVDQYLRGPGFDQKIANVIKYECFMLHVFPNSCHSKMLLSWINTEEMSNKEFFPATIDMVDATITNEMADKSVSLPTEAGLRVSGRGNGYQSVDKLRGACNYLHSLGDTLSPFNSQQMIDRMSTLSK